MEELSVLTSSRGDVQSARVRLLVADDDHLERSLIALYAGDALGEITVLEAEDGAEAIQIGLQQRPEIGLLAVDMPGLGGFEAAVTLRELQPRMRLALQTGNPRAHRERAFESGLPLFGKLEVDRTLAWLRAQVPDRPRKRSLVCGACGYGARRAVAPDRCPMCQAENAWIDASRRAAIAAPAS